jgi:GDP-L-fucose synthase
MREEYLLTGELEKTSEPYAIAKIAGVRMCQSYNRQYGVHYISVIPATVYGPDDHFDCEAGHVIPSLIERFHQAKLNNINKVTVWGTGKPRREFIYVDDLAEACLFLMENCDESEVVNVGVGYDVSIEELAHRISQIVAYKGHVEFDSSKPDGAPRKLLDCSRISGLGWMAQVGLEEGVALTYKSYRDEIEIR